LDENSIEIDNTSQTDPQDPGWYNCEVFLKVPDKGLLEDINNVEYTLHKSFAEPVVVVNKRDDGFRLRKRGWGEFRVKATIHMNDGSKITKYHWLNLASHAAIKS
jgi:transcription initiation factor IIF auxiliary subunit